MQSPEKRTIPLLISNLGSSYSPDFGVIMTAIVISTLPTALVFFLMQKQFVANKDAQASLGPEAFVYSLSAGTFIFICGRPFSARYSKEQRMAIAPTIVMPQKMLAYA
ncbi:Lactose transport system permease protein LacG [Paenibacillus konkukensis]|uniref:Lactose transport system permease protein LacG n=1 Tax=Paenibacillus konkukensis TaxID=2020716 RepID=A0ABY4RUT3_9BACL|nr:Lactose transport system permease protein LacG [Paenibacillus konkukensis]